MTLRSGCAKPDAADGPAYLREVLERRGIRQWTDIGFSSIYYLLRKLEKRGLIEAHKPAGPKARRTFYATTEGRATASWTALALIEDPKPVQHPVLVGLANLLLLSEEEYAGAIRSRLAQVDARLTSIKSAEQGQDPLLLAAREVFSYSLNLLEAERSWLAARTGRVPDDTDEG